ncbi:MAG: hypothetical protein WBJ19_08970, partial [Rhodoferax sp.]
MVQIESIADDVPDLLAGCRHCSIAAPVRFEFLLPHPISSSCSIAIQNVITLPWRDTVEYGL